MRIFFIPFACIIAALSLFSAGALAATPSELPTACATATGAASTSTTTTTTATATATTTATTATTARDDEGSDSPEDRTGHAIGSCVVALHEDGEHGMGHADRDGEDVPAGKDDAPTVASATPTTSTSTVATATTARATHRETAAQHGHGHDKTEGDKDGHDD